MSKENKGGFKLIHLLLIVFFVYFGVTVFKQNRIIKELKSEKTEMNAQIEQIKADIDYLNEEIESAGTLKFIERVARDDYGMVKPRETIYIDKDKQKNPFDSKTNKDGKTD
ncbi:MAG: septum formation initiator family protein [Tissierellia bacterium]|nr:septum formation initiator family protein [Tissierellia bacterium]